MRESQVDARKCSMETIADWYQYCREAIVERFLANQDVRAKIGGPGKIVQIDEAKFGSRKYERGRIIEGHWVLGMIEKDSNEDLRLEICPDHRRTADVLIPLIKKHVAPGTEIHTDSFKSYDRLDEHGYVHKKVNHNEEFVAGDGTHTQRIESCWRPIRARLRTRQVARDRYADHIVEYQWRRWCRKNNKDLFQDLIDSIKDLYPIE